MWADRESDLWKRQVEEELSKLQARTAHFEKSKVFSPDFLKRAWAIFWHSTAIGIVIYIALFLVAACFAAMAGGPY